MRAPEGKETGTDRLDRAFDGALAPYRRDDGPLGVLFSGGVDSSLIAWELHDRPNLTLVTVGVPGSPDLVAARSASALLSLPWTEVVVPIDEVRSVAAEIAEETDRLAPVPRSVQIAFAVAVRSSPVDRLLCGQGADELFLGYAHFRGRSAAEAARIADGDLGRLITEDWPRSQRIAARFGRSVFAPYLDPGFMEAARSIPVDRRLPEPEPKSWFRSWARHRGLPAEIAARPKRALQYGSGVDRALRDGERRTVRNA